MFFCQRLFSILVITLIFYHGISAQVFAQASVRIIGGEPVQHSDFSWMVSLGWKNTSGTDRHFCGGSLVTSNLVLTAAHCVYELNPGEVDIFYGTNLLSDSESGRRVNISEFIVHPQYRPNLFDYDIALIRLESDIEAVEFLQIIPDDFQVVTDQMTSVIGWGITDVSVGVVSDSLQQVDVPIVSQETCREIYPTSLTERMLCAGYVQGGSDSCRGDSGGPLIAQNSGVPVQIGIVSFGRGCALPNGHGVYSRLSALKDFLETHLPAETSPPPPAEQILSSQWTSGPYGNNEDISEVLGVTNAVNLKVSVQGSTESNYDFIYIIDQNNNELARLSGEINEEIIVNGDRITVRLTSDYSITRSGVTVLVESHVPPTPPTTPSDLTEWSSGNYSNNSHVVKELSIENATNLQVNILGETERNYDFVEIYTTSGQLVRKLSGVISTTFQVPGNRIRVEFKSDSSIVKPGVTVSISSVSPISGEALSWSSGAYTNNTDQSEQLTIPGAAALKIVVEGETESNYDFLTLYDGNRQQIARLSGVMSNSYQINGDTLSLRFTSDYSVTKSGVTVRVEQIEALGGDQDHPPSLETSWNLQQYQNNQSITKILGVEGAQKIAINVNGSTELNYDFLSIFDMNGNLIGRFSGGFGEEIIVTGNRVRITFESDYSITDSGFQVTVTSRP